MFKNRPSNEWLEDAYLAQKKTTQAIGDEIGVKQATVALWVRKAGIPTRRRHDKMAELGRNVGGWNKIPMPPREEVYDDYVTRRKSTSVIARERGVSTATVNLWLRRYKIPARAQSECGKVDGPHLDRDWLYDQYVTQKKSTITLAQDLNVDKKTVNRALRRFGIDRRSTSEALRNNPKRSGENNPAWKGGLSSQTHLIRTSAEYLEASRRVRRRDKGCLLCISRGLDPKGKNHEVHHIDPISSALLLVFDVGNMILLCEDCHLKIRGKEKHWKKRLLGLIQRNRA